MESNAKKYIRRSIFERIGPILGAYSETDQKAFTEIIDRTLVSGELASILITDKVYPRSGRFSDIVKFMNPRTRFEEIPDELREDFLKFKALEFVTITLSNMLPEEIKYEILKK